MGQDASLAIAAIGRYIQDLEGSRLRTSEMVSHALTVSELGSLTEACERLRPGMRIATAELRQAELSPELPALGATLRELRGLRAMRHVGSGDAVRLPPPSPSNTKAASGVSQDPQHPAPDASPAEHPEEAAQAQDDAGSDALPEVELEPVPGVRA